MLPPDKKTFTIVKTFRNFYLHNAMVMNEISLIIVN